MKFATLVAFTLLGLAHESLCSYPTGTFDTSTCTWGTYTDPSGNYLPAHGSQCDNIYQIYISPTDWLNGDEFYAYCNTNNQAYVRPRVTSSYQDCANADYIGISPRLLYCGTYDEVAARCPGSKNGYVIIDRLQLDAGVVEASACPATDDGVACPSIYHTHTDATNCHTTTATASHPTYTFDTDDCSWKLYTESECSLPRLGPCTPETHAFQSWTSSSAFEDNRLFYMYCDEGGLIRYRLGATLMGYNGGCESAEYVGVSRGRFYCDSYENIVRNCGFNSDGFVIAEREKLENGEFDVTACPVVTDNGCCPRRHPFQS